MTSREFCYWLQGYFELMHAGAAPYALTAKQAELIQRHLALVFKHEIDGSYPNADALTAVHAGTDKPQATGPKFDPGVLIRC